MTEESVAYFTENGGFDAEAASEYLEQESLRYSRRLSEEWEAEN